MSAGRRATSSAWSPRPIRRAIALGAALVALPLAAAALPGAAQAAPVAAPSLTHHLAVADAFRTEGTVSPSAAQAVTALVSLKSSPASRARVVAWAKAHGLSVHRADSSNVTVSGSATQMSAAFSARLTATPSRTAPNGPASYLRPATAPQVPAELQSVASSVDGLDTRPLYQPRDSGLSTAGFTGPGLRDAYAAPRDPASGAGITVATVQFSGFHTSDLVDYSDAGAIPLFAGQFTLVSVDGANPSVPVGTADEEVVLDTESILAAAPMARQRVYVAPNGLTGSIDAFTQIADDVVAGKVQVVSTSWGHCETGVSPTEQNAIQAQVQRIVSAGGTVSAASGDNGKDDCGNSTARVDFPASIPEVVAVGGTSLTNGYQTAWSGSGGGVSTLFAKPGYQSGVAGSGRHVPDIALLADPNTGFAVTYRGGLATAGGTSLASPLFAGLLAGALSEHGSTTGVGDIHSDLYGAPADAFQDVVTGSNGFAAGVGYDQATGLGAPRFGALADALGIPAVSRATYHPIDPTRIADTRSGLGVPKARLGPGQSFTVAIPSSAPGVPASGVTAAVLNVTAVGPSATTYLSVFPTGAANGSATSSVNALPKAVTPNLVTVKTGTAGSVTVYNSAGSVDVLLDLAGYYARDSADTYTSVAPSRLLDTRNGTGAPTGPVGEGSTIDLQIEGAGSLPVSGIDSVVLNVTAVNATKPTYVSVYPTGFANGPLSSSLNVSSNRAVANLVISKVSGSGEVTLYNAVGSVDLLADVQGYYTAGAGQTFVPVPPVRVLDTRPAGALGGNSVGTFLVAADESRPATVVLNLTAVRPTAYTFLSLFPTNVSVGVGKTSSTLNVNPGAVRANLAQTAVVTSDQPAEQVYNSVGAVDVLADIGGYFSSEPELLPQTTVTLAAPSTASPGSFVSFMADAEAGGPAVATLAPGARVTFVEAGVGVLGSATIAGDGSATFSTNSLSLGAHTVYAVVAAHDGIAGSASAPVTITVS